MNTKKFVEKLKDVLSEEDILAFEKDIKKTIEEETSIRTEAIIKDMDEKADEYCEIMIEKKTSEIKENLINEYEKKLEDLEKDIVEKLDVFLESEISSQIKPELIESVAKSNTYEPIVEGILKLFEEKYVAPDVEGNTLVKKLEEELSTIKEELDQQISKNIENNQLLEKSAIAHLIDEKTKDLSESQVINVKKFFKDKDFEEVESKIDSFVDLVLEKANEEDKKELDESKESDEINDESQLETIIESKNESKKIEDEDINDRVNGSIETANNYLV